MPRELDFDGLQCVLAATGSDRPWVEYNPPIPLDGAISTNTLDLVRNIAALANYPYGGYVVAAGDDPALFDAVFTNEFLQDLLSEYIDDPLDTSCFVHHVNGQTVALVGVEPGLAATVLDRDGRAPDETAPVFPAGEIPVRRGTWTEPLRLPNRRYYTGKDRKHLPRRSGSGHHVHDSV